MLQLILLFFQLIQVRLFLFLLVANTLHVFANFNTIYFLIMHCSGFQKLLRHVLNGVSMGAAVTMNVMVKIECKIEKVV